MCASQRCTATMKCARRIVPFALTICPKMWPNDSKTMAPPFPIQSLKMNNFSWNSNRMRNAMAQTKTSRQSSILYATKPFKYVILKLCSIPCCNFQNVMLAFQLGAPEFSGEKDCEYSFNWETSLACNKPTPCRIIDPITGFVYGIISMVFELHVLNRVCLCVISVTIWTNCLANSILWSKAAKSMCLVCALNRKIRATAMLALAWWPAIRAANPHRWASLTANFNCHRNEMRLHFSHTNWDRFVKHCINNGQPKLNLHAKWMA